MGSASPSTYDFIVVGAGAAGCTIASRLARSTKRPQVLLLEAGGRNETKEWRIDSDRWLHRLNLPQAWGYNTVPQKHLDDLVVAYDRGKGLGGSTAVNFCAWDIGPSADHDEIARLVGDDEWSWENAQKRYMRLESYYGDASHVQEDFKKYLDPDPKVHGHDGPIKVGFPAIWESPMMETMDIWFDAGYKANPDLNSGDPIGLGVGPNTAYKGIRSTAADQLTDAPHNLHVLTDAQVARVLFDKHGAQAIETLDGRKFKAIKEIILSAGSLDTPRILMHSGIGPAEQLSKYQIPVVLNTPNVGQNLKDHHHIAPTFECNDTYRERLEFYQSKEKQAAARTQWGLDQTGPLSEIACCLAIGMLKSDEVYESAEFNSLPESTKAHMRHPTVPSYEIVLNGAAAEYFIDPQALKNPIMNIFVFVMNPQSVGSVTLHSSDPSIPLLFDPNYFSHPYDRRLAVAATREVLKVVASKGFQKQTIGMLHGPKSDSDEDILAYWRNTTGSTWHMTGTCKMGKSEGLDGACVGADFRLFGAKKLRIADMSVVPLLPNNHTQTTAYLVGLMAGDKIVAEYGLDN